MGLFLSLVLSLYSWGLSNKASARHVYHDVDLEDYDKLFSSFFEIIRNHVNDALNKQYYCAQMSCVSGEVLAMRSQDDE